MTKPQLSAFAKAMRRQHTSSRVGSASTQKLVINQSPTLKPFTPEQRAGQPLKAAAWRA